MRKATPLPPKNSLMCCIRKPLWTLCFDSYCGILRSLFVVPRFRGTPVLNFFYNRFLAQSHTVLVIDGITGALASPGPRMWCTYHIFYGVAYVESHWSRLRTYSRRPDLQQETQRQDCFLLQYAVSRVFFLWSQILWALATPDCVIDRACNIQPSLITASKQGHLGCKTRTVGPSLLGAGNCWGAKIRERSGLDALS